MKKAFASTVRLGLLVGVLLFVVSMTKGPQAQATCQTFTTDTFDCPSCCSHAINTFNNNIIASEKTGTQSIQATDYSCGTANAGCPTACSGTYPQAVPDSTCCIKLGAACDPNIPCCPGNTCQNGTCLTKPVSCPYGCTVEGGKCFCPPSPILLDLDGHGFVLTNAQNGVSFDISGTGDPIQMGWTAAGADDAFLALPGADGLVHNGRQLFGNFTPQPPSDNPNGFAALAVYDDPKNGGNGNGVIDPGDAIYSHLRLWTDANHDGICQPEEMHTLASLGVTSISLHYRLDKKTDQYGNAFRYRAEIDPHQADPDHVGRTAYDVYFVSVQP
jgi:hypothetical protein